MDDNGGAIRLADYIVVIAFDESQIRHGNSVGNIVQRLPQHDWPDISLSPNLEVFSQPQGWSLSAEVKPATFFVNTLTDILGSRQYAYCLQVQEPCGSIIEDVDDVTLSGAILYKPKVIVILSRFPFFELFRNCLNRFHVALLDSECNAEAMTATLLSSTKLAIGAPPVSFNFASERLCVRAPLSRTVPVTSDKVALFMQQLGTIQNVLSLLSAILTDRKVLFRSSSMTRLADSCYAICALLYPFEYPHTFVPVLPEQLIEYLESPTPYIMGLLHSVRNLNVELDTTIVVDLDIGAVYIPPTVTLPLIPEPFAQRFICSLQMVLNPSLSNADDAWKMGQPPHPSCEVQDKRIRACFIRFFADILIGYRCCLEVVRLHTPPLIVFHKSAFLGLRGFSSCPLIRTFLDSLLFQSFICERGLPYRICDLFDDLVSHSNDHINGDQSKTSILDSITSIAEKLRDNEHQDSSFSMTPLLTNKRFLMSNVPTKLPLFDEKLVARFIEENRKYRCNTPHSTLRPRKVPTGNWLCMKEERLGAVSRRLQVLSSCLHYIFDLKLSDARKMLCAVELSMRSVNARVALCQLLWLNLNPVNRATLLPQQFELIIRLINCALNQESKEDEHGIAYAMLYLSNIYCRRLTAGVHQFAYTCIQEHPVWENEQFWEAAFFHDVHRQLRRLYMPIKEDLDCPFSVQENATDTWNLMEEPSGMDLVSERLANVSRYDEGELRMRAAEEHSIIFGQAKHYINLMVYLRIPLDVSKLRRVNVRELERRSDRNGRRREVFDDETVVSESESDVESGFIESDDGDLGNATVKWIRRLIDRICSAAGLEHAQIERLCDEIPGFVALHIDNLEQVYTESKRLSPMHKPKLLQPALLLPSEHVLLGGMRVFLLNDGRSLGNVCGDSPQSLLPAEGAIFLTNYRLVFKGQPCDPFLCEQVVIRTVTIMSITKEKQIADQSIQNSSQLEGIPTRVAHQLHDAFQIRSANAQLMKVAFDEEVSSEKAEEFLQTLASLRWPPTLPHTLFAYSTASSILSSTFARTSTKHKYGTIRELKKTLIRNPLKDKKRARTPLKALPYPNGHETMPIALSAGASPTTSRSSHVSDYLDLSDVTDLATSQLHHHYMIDYERLGLTHRTFRLSNVNSKYELSKSYPSVVVVPSSVADESFAKIGKGFKHGRFPVVTWKSEDDALLIRGAGLASQTVVARIKKQANLLGNVDTQGSGFVGSRVSLNSRDFSAPNSVEMQERYMSTFVALSPHATSVDGRSLLSESMESLLSLDSMVTFDGISLASATPDIYRKTQTSDFTRHATNFVRSSGGKTTMRPMNNGRSVIYGDYVMNQARRATTFLPSSQASRPLLSLSRNSLYVFGDRNQAKVLKLDKGCEFIPVSYPSAHNVKIAFKKFLRAVCPGWAPSEEHSISFYKQLDDSNWLQMISSLLHLSNAVVDLIDLQHSSVCICIEDGWDATSQIMALSQLLLDPYYRTIDGFRVLIEKEWLAFGHRFSHRGNHSVVSQNSGIAPMFLMFLDAVHQVLSRSLHSLETLSTIFSLLPICPI
uniref:Myotubularin-related protein 5 n=1 Tax=Parascaris univalens TaxID=6257 RepID=A0A915AWS5_PARUN